MNVILVNRSHISTESLQAMVDFLAPCFGECLMPVQVTVRSRPSGCSSWGNAQWGESRWRERGVYSVTLFVGSLPAARVYPYTRTYKKRAGGYVANSPADEIFHTLAHELRHIEQYDACRRQKALDAKEPKSAPEGGANEVYWRAMWDFGSYLIWYNKRYASGSCEVDAELVAHALLDRYRFYLENVVLARRAA